MIAVSRRAGWSVFSEPVRLFPATTGARQEHPWRPAPDPLWGGGRTVREVRGFRVLRSRCHRADHLQLAQPRSRRYRPETGTRQGLCSMSSWPAEITSSTGALPISTGRGCSGGPAGVRPIADFVPDRSRCRPPLVAIVNHVEGPRPIHTI